MVELLGNEMTDLDKPDKPEKPQGFSSDKGKTVIIQGHLSLEELNLIRGILTLEQDELDKDEMAEVLATIRGITLEAAMILISSWYDAGRNKQEWGDSELNHWIMTVLATKIGSDSMNRFAAIAERVAGRTDVSGNPLRPVLHYLLASKRKGYGGKYISDGTLHAPTFTTDIDEAMEFTGGELVRMAYDWTLDWNAVVWKQEKP